MEKSSPYQSQGESLQSPYERLDVDIEQEPESKLESEIQRFRTILESKETAEVQEASSDTVDQAVKVRIERSRREGAAILDLKKLGEMNPESGEEVAITLTGLQEKFGKLKSALESRLWRGIFENLSDGDTVMTVTEPQDKIFSLKIFNDYILGQQKTDSVIGARRKILQKHLGTVGIDLIDANFKFSSFRIPAGSEIHSEAVTQALDAASEEISTTIIQLIEDDLASQDTISPAKKEKLEYLMQQLEKDGYPVRYGMSQVRGNEMLDKSVAVSEAMVAARSFERKGSEFGQEYEEGLESKLLDTFYECSNILVNQYDNKIKDADGFTYQIFEKIPFMEVGEGVYELEVPFEMTDDVVKALQSSLKNYDFEYDAAEGEVFVTDNREEVWDDEGNFKGYQKKGKTLKVKHVFRESYGYDEEAEKELAEEVATVMPYRGYDELKGDQIIGEPYEKEVNGQTIKMVKVKRKALYQKYGDNNYRRVINKDLVRAVRKGKFKPYVGDNPDHWDYTEATAALEVIKDYIDVLNTIDLVRPYTEAELTENFYGDKFLEQTFEEIDEHISAIDDLLEGNVLVEGFEDRIKKAADYLEGAMKNKEFTTRGVFHERVSLMDKSAVLSIDIGDLGVDVLRTYEEDLFAVDANMISMQEVYAGVGDRETYAMNSIRDRLVELYDDIFDRQDGEKIVGLVEGGDEIVFAFDLNREGESGKIDEFRRRLQGEIGVPMRVVLTSHEVKRKASMQGLSVKEYYPHVESNEYIDPRLEAHILSMDRSERGADASKTCEAMLRKLHKMIENVSAYGPLTEAKIREMVILQGLQIKEWEVVDTLELSDRQDFEEVKPLTFKVTYLDGSVAEMTPDALQEKISGFYEQVSHLHQAIEDSYTFTNNIRALVAGAVYSPKQYRTEAEESYERKVFDALGEMRGKVFAIDLKKVSDEGRLVVDLVYGESSSWTDSDSFRSYPDMTGKSPNEVSEFLSSMYASIKKSL